MNDIQIPIGREQRLVVREWCDSAGTRMVEVCPELLDPANIWRRHYQGLLVAPGVVYALVAALITTAADILDNVSPSDPMPTDEDRELSRRP